MPSDTASSRNLKMGKGPETIPASPRDTPASKFRKALSRMASKSNVIRDQLNNKQQDIIVYTDVSVTKDKSGWCFITVKQGATTVHEDSTDYTVSTPNLTMEVGVVTYALRWIASRGDSLNDHTCHHPHRFKELAKTKVEVGNDRLASKATLISGLRFGRSEVLRNLRQYLWVQNQGQNTIDRLEERGVERGSARRSSLKGRERPIVNQMNIGTVSRATLGKPPREGVERIWSVPSE